VHAWMHSSICLCTFPEMGREIWRMVVFSFFLKKSMNDLSHTINTKTNYNSMLQCINDIPPEDAKCRVLLAKP